MNSDNPTRIWLGGAPCVARPVRANENTIANRAKQVAVRMIAGASDATARIKIRWIALLGPPDSVPSKVLAVGAGSGAGLAVEEAAWSDAAAAGPGPA